MNSSNINDFEKILQVKIDSIEVNPFQPRKQFSEEELADLSASIASVGLIHPPLVRHAAQAGHYELIAGERRLRACQLLGWKTIPVVIRKTNSTISAQAALIENVQRAELNPLEIAQSLQRLVDEFGMTQEQLAVRIGKKRSTVANYLRLLSLPASIRQSITNHLISMGHAKVVLSLEEPEKQHLLHELILRDELTVREAEERAHKITQKSKERKLVYQTRNFHLEQLEERLQKALGTKVSIQSQGKKGKVCISYYTYDDLDKLIHLLNPETSLI